MCSWQVSYDLIAGSYTGKISYLQIWVVNHNDSSDQ